MKEYRVIASEAVLDDLDRFVKYLLFVKKNEQAAGSLLDDYDDTIAQLQRVAGSLALCDDQRLGALGYHRVNFLRHRYFLLYRIGGDVAIVDAIGHERQDLNRFLW